VKAAEFLQQRCGVEVQPSAMFDVQARPLGSGRLQQFS
jgi:hypothetical protein